MGGNSYDTYGEGSASTYWRRRFIVLAIGLVVFGLAAWGLSSALAVKSVPASRGRPAPTSRPVLAQAQGRVSRVRISGVRVSGVGSAGSGSNDRSGHHPAQGHRTQASRAGAAPVPGDRIPARVGRRAAATRRLGPSRWPDRRWPGGKRPVRWRPVRSRYGRHQVAGGKTGAGQAAGHGTILPAFCGRRDIVLSVFAGQTQFGQKDSPTFELSIVSTQPAECTFNIGSAHLALVIKEGPTRIWNSADCPDRNPQPRRRTWPRRPNGRNSHLESQDLGPRLLRPNDAGAPQAPTRPTPSTAP